MHPIDEEDVEGQVYSEQSIHVCTKLLDDIIQITVVTVMLSLHRKYLQYLHLKNSST